MSCRGVDAGVHGGVTDPCDNIVLKHISCFLLLAFPCDFAIPVKVLGQTWPSRSQSSRAVSGQRSGPCGSLAMSERSGVTFQ